MLTNEVSTRDRVLSPREGRLERRRERLRAWRAANREYLREYSRCWKGEHPERVMLHRQNEYAKRRSKRRRLRLRREAQGRRRELKRSLLKRILPPPGSSRGSGNDSL
jgi:hypothetical protein